MPTKYVTMRFMLLSVVKVRDDIGLSCQFLLRSLTEMWAFNIRSSLTSWKRHQTVQPITLCHSCHIVVMVKNQTHKRHFFYNPRFGMTRVTPQSPGWHAGWLGVTHKPRPLANFAIVCICYRLSIIILYAVRLLSYMSNELTFQLSGNERVTPLDPLYDAKLVWKCNCRVTRQ